MGRTTLALDDDLLRKLKERAARQGRTLQDVANELLRHALYHQERPEKVKLELHGWEATEQPGVDLLDRDKLFDLMNGR
jgi:plasmid stability protein